MKTTATLLALALVAALPARAQFFRPETVTGAVLGGAVGAVIGHNDDRHGWEGAAYGAAAGAIIGSVVGDNREREWRGTQVPSPAYRGGHYPGYSSYRRGPAPRYVYRPPAVVYAPSYPIYRRPPVYVVQPAPRSYGYGRRPSYARTGVLLGGVTGAIIGHNDNRHGWEGAAYGAGAGLILGAIADNAAARADAEARYQDELRIAASQTTPAQVSAPATTAPQQVTINNYYYAPTGSTPMSGANGLFGR